MTKSTKLMFLGFLVMVAGAILLYSLATAIPAGTEQTINPFVLMFYQSEICTDTSSTSFTCSGATNQLEQFTSIIQGEELFAFGLVLTGLIMGIVGYRRNDAPTQPAKPNQPTSSAESTDIPSRASTP